MSDARLRTVLASLATNLDLHERSLGAALCATGAETVGVAGAGIALRQVSGDMVSLGASDDVMAELEELERTLGEGPCIDAFAQRAPIAEPDLASPLRARWLEFTPGALRAGARAAFGFPLQLGAARFGALNLYSSSPGDLSDEQHQTALVVADVATHAVLADLHDVARPGALDDLYDIGSYQQVVHQATGMVAVQLSVSIPDALSVLRARSYADGRPVSEIAADVVARRLRFS